MARRTQLEKRLEALERRAGGNRMPIVETAELRLVDDAGRVRAMLDVGRTGPRLAMMRSDGTVVLELMVTGDGASLRFADATGDTRVFVGATRGAARVGMADAHGASRLFLGLKGNGEPILRFYDAAQRQMTKPTKRARTTRGAAKHRPSRSMTE